MTEQVMVAVRNATVRTDDGTLYRIERGKTYANPAHPAVVQYPTDWQALEVQLPAPAAAPGPGHAGMSAGMAAQNEIRELTEQLAVAEEEAETYSDQLGRISERLAHYGQPADPDVRNRAGWLADIVLDVLDEHFVHSRPVDPEPAPPVVVPGPADGMYVAPDADEREDIREWAASNGRPAAARGTLARALVEEYRAAQRG